MPIQATLEVTQVRLSLSRCKASSFTPMLHNVFCSLYSLQIMLITSIHTFLRLPCAFLPYSSNSLHAFTQSSSDLRPICPNHCSLFRLKASTTLSIPSLYRKSAFVNLFCRVTPHVHLTILISALQFSLTFSCYCPSLSHIHHAISYTCLLNSPLYSQTYSSGTQHWLQFSELIPRFTNSS